MTSLDRNVLHNTTQSPTCRSAAQPRSCHLVQFPGVMMQTASIRSDDVLEADGSIKLRKVVLADRLDMLGMEDIALKLTSLTAIKPLPVILDLRDVSFLASIGIRNIISSARALDQKGGRMVILLGNNELVKASA
ncbi:STAS domain-containing protein [Cyanobium sp. Cruz CV13-4-11]|uniref:STAS domain-containing protein n=2 Tax=unclassified Cyanobium TaxID=2627006 RepID=UPI0020CBF60F|nr:STAS domain-containing protein [Cyanobium sp. Cruz CV13-4-11]